jgi:hypothetical protein
MEGLHDLPCPTPVRRAFRTWKRAQFPCNDVVPLVQWTDIRNFEDDDEDEFSTSDLGLYWRRAQDLKNSLVPII